MESTGVYWKPVHAILEDTFQVIIGNAKHMRNVPGRKTDVKDAEWIADLLRHGLIKPSFVPPKDIRQLRELVRYRTKLTQSRTAERNRLLKLLEDANIKLSNVASDVFGKSGMEMLEALIAGTETPDQMAQHARGRLRDKIPELARALHGRVEAHHRQILRLQLRRMSELDRDIGEIDAEVDCRLEPYREDRERLDGIPGVDWILTAVFVAELGLNMAVFPTSNHAAAWTGIAPGSFQSAGKPLHHQARKGNIHLRTALVQAANAAAHTKETWLGEKFRRLRARRGHKRAAMAIGRKILTAAYTILRTKCSYRELGANYIDQTAKSNVGARLARRLTKLGYFVLPPNIGAPAAPAPGSAA